MASNRLGSLKLAIPNHHAACNRRLLQHLPSIGFYAGERAPATGRNTGLKGELRHACSRLTRLDDHVAVNKERPVVTFASSAANGTPVLLGGFLASFGFDGSAIDFDFSPLGILTSTDTGSPILAFGIDIPAIDCKRP